jgi:hypothetical protein
MTKVTVTPDSKGNHIYAGEKGISSIRVTQTRFNDAGFEVELSGFLKVKDANVGKYPVGTQIDGKIIISETLSPAFEGQKPKTAGKDGDVIRHGGAPVYRETLYRANLNAQDTLIASDKVAAKVEAGAEG